MQNKSKMLNGEYSMLSLDIRNRGGIRIYVFMCYLCKSLGKLNRS